MIQLPIRSLPAGARRSLATWQSEVDSEKGYAAQILAAKRLFSLRNKRTNTTFAAVKSTLDAMCSGARRCCYCEDSAADEVEHIKPKNLFPELVFAWENYL